MALAPEARADSERRPPERTDSAGDLASAGGFFAVFARRPALSALTGALFLSFSGILVRVSGASPTTAASFRAVYALPFLAALAVVERRRLGPRPFSQRFWAYVAGVSLAVDLIFFHYGIKLIGAGLATVMGNVQVVFVGAVAWLALGERPSQALLAGVPIAMAGVVLISGVLGGGAYGENPQLGVLVGLVAAATYGGYLLLLRKGRDRTQVAGPILDASIACAVTAALWGIATNDFDPIPRLPEHFWLAVLALACQFGGGMLVAVALPRLPAVVTSLILLIQPVAAVLLSMLLVAERPSIFQLLGVGFVVLGVAVGTVPFRQLVARGKVALG
jgi:drug/metabolite transporter (DMT)-like permease